MALGAPAEFPDCGVKIVPVGMNYFNPHKFRSRAVIEFGTPIDIPPELLKKYKAGGGNLKREAVFIVSRYCHRWAQSVTVRCSDWDTLI